MASTSDASHFAAGRPAFLITWKPSYESRDYGWPEENLLALVRTACAGMTNTSGFPLARE